MDSLRVTAARVAENEYVSAAGNTMGLREYYGRLWRDVGLTLVIFSQGHIVLCLAAGITGAGIGIYIGATPRSLALISIGSAVAGYLVVLALVFVMSVLRAPARLDQQRQDEIFALRQTHALEIGKWERRLADIHIELTDCRERLASKHPADEHKEELVREKLDGFSEMESEVIRTLLHHGPLSSTELQNILGTEHEFSVLSAIGKADRAGLVHPIQGPRMAGHMRWSVNEHLMDALRDVLHPPPRPANPSPR